MIETVQTLGILRDDIEIGPATVPEGRFAANMRRWYGPNSKTGAVIVYFSGSEGVNDLPDTQNAGVSPFWHEGVA